MGTRLLIKTIILFFVLSSCATAQRKQVSIDRQEARKAYLLLNDIRKNPEKYAKELGLRDVKQVTRATLQWNNQLAKAAEKRAYDMAMRNYFDHVSPDGFGPNYYINEEGYTLSPDWLKDRRANNFESIAANHPTASDGIKAFIIGHNSPGFMHRKHVLGLDAWNGSLKDIGIGFARIPNGSTYKTYLCVIIAKHDW